MCQRRPVGCGSVLYASAWASIRSGRCALGAASYPARSAISSQTARKLERLHVRAPGHGRVRRVGCTLGALRRCGPRRLQSAKDRVSLQRHGATGGCLGQNRACLQKGRWTTRQVVSAKVKSFHWRHGVIQTRGRQNDHRHDVSDPIKRGESRFCQSSELGIIPFTAPACPMWRRQCVPPELMSAAWIAGVASGLRY